jgi:protein SCO1
MKISHIIIVTLALVLLLVLGFPLMMLSGDKQGRVVLDEKIELPFAVSKDAKVILLYLGYVGCRTICMPSLEESAKIFDDMNTSSSVSFYFVNISKEGVGAKEFAAHFHKDFKGLQLSRAKTSALMHELRAYSSDALVEGGDIYHTGYLYLIKQENEGGFTLKSMYYTRPFDAKSIILDIKKELK